MIKFDFSLDFHNNNEQIYFLYNFFFLIKFKQHIWRIFATTQENIGGASEKKLYKTNNIDLNCQSNECGEINLPLCDNDKRGSQ